MESKKVFIYANDTEMSAKIEKLLRKKLVKSGLRVYEQLEADTALIICIGGDGTLLRCLRCCDFPTIPVVGINTGHLGFFQELMPDKIDDFIFQYQQGNFTVHSYSTVKSRVETSSGTMRQIALNEIAIKGVPNYPVQLNISINDSFIERFSGDGICVSTPAGSTAYNYSLGGAIVDPRLNLMQVAPIAPINTVAYRSFTSSILLPANDKLSIIPCDDDHRHLSIVADGFAENYEDIRRVELSLSRKKINLVRFEYTNFWEKAKSKFL